MPSRAKPPEASSRSGPAQALARLGLTRDIDRVLHLPLRYDDETRLAHWDDLADGEVAQVDGVVERSEAKTLGSRRGWLVTLRASEVLPASEWADASAASAGRQGARARDSGVRLLLRFLHAHPAYRKAFVPGATVRVRGEVRGGFWGREMVHPVFRPIEPGAPLPTRLTPVYPTVAALPQAYLRRVISSALQRADLTELLDEPRWRAEVQRLWPDAAGWPSLAEAVRRLHQPPSGEAHACLEPHHPARRRLAWEELLAQQLSQTQARSRRAQMRAPSLAAVTPCAVTPCAVTPWTEIDAARPAAPAERPESPQPPAPSAVPATVKLPDQVRDRLLKALPFALTPAQTRVVAEIAADLAREVPMHRLLQGDVGAGKTVVAALAAAQAIDAGWQCALMAPTEILVGQHAAKLAAWLEPLGVRTAWLSGSRQGRARQAARAAVADGSAQLVIGTQAMIEDGVEFARLGLVVIDEQHRFGVEQRLALRRKLGEGLLQPHSLGMSATPIPRTLAMALFADLDVSTIDELPPGRTPIATRVFGNGRRDEVIARLRDEMARGRQVYWVCPLVEAVETDEVADPGGAAMGKASSTDDLGKSGAKRGAATVLSELTNAIDTHAELTAALPGVGVGLLHGRMAARDKAAVMKAFVAGELSLLVATTVIEVGVDVPNASVMVIEHAERFGLAQLHQLRGRVGRGAAASVCVLLYGSPVSAVARERLQVMARTNDGFEIARRDLELRGPGEFLGARQSGAALMRFADVVTDADWIEPSRELAHWLWREHPSAAQRQIDRFRGGQSEFLNA